MKVDTGYRQSSYCASGSCVQVAVLSDGQVALRDSKEPSLPPHVFTSDEWVAFTLGVKAGEFDYPETGI
ncbi:DUF397 domain-containing protein [Actinokineospora sp. HUAS TT18]|uniref:DUF397 domain-containing protein n=1 Tax=Actinokineospora sp. HUAS TT18 TaxID=3447451 RepID=UPI003F52649D